MKRTSICKKIVASILAMCLIINLGLNASSPQAATTKTIGIFLDGKEIVLDTEPFIINGRTLVPLRGIFEKLGATVDWNKYTQQAIIKTKDTEIILEVGNKYVLVDGKIAQLDAATMLQKDRTFVPFRFVAEALGHKVEWDALNYRVIITTTVASIVKDTSLPTIGSLENLNQLLHYSEVLNTYIYDNFNFLNKDLVALPSLPSQDSEQNSMNESSKNEVTGSTDSSSGKDFSDTNNQTLGVDEGDIIKTDGNYIYTLNQNRIHIVAANPLKPTLIKTIDISDQRGYVTDIYLSGEYLIAIGSSNSYYGYPTEINAPFNMRVMPQYSTPSTFVITYSLKDITNPILLQDYDFEGGYTSSRLVEGKLYMITNKSFYDWRIQPVTPKFVDNRTKKATYIDLNSIYYFPDYVTPNFMLTIGIDLTTNEIDVKSYLGSAEGVYVSNEHMYLTLTRYEYGNQKNSGLFMPNYETTTSIYKFAYKDGKIDYTAEGNVDGSILNQFSLDEYEGNLRIATTTGDMWDEANPSKNNVYILDSLLKPMGELTGLAEGERIYSTRFSGDRIYMVTFRQVDPFFVIDASEPTKPIVLGYLKIPGFSTYMHVLDENHVLGFGTETIELDGRVTTGGLKLSLFDVTNPAEPLEKMKQVIGAAGTNSDIAYNHKALMISLSKGIMAFPINVSEVPYVTNFSGAYVYRLTSDSFSFMGKVTHQNSTTLLGEPPYQYYDYNYTINRLVYIEDYLYSVSGGKLVVTSLLTMKDVSSVDLPLKVFSTNID
jgi:inhibitor of cysteine peptidase